MTHPESPTLFSPGLLNDAIGSALQLGERLTRSVGEVTDLIGDQVRLLSERGPAPSCSGRPQACWLPRELAPVSSVVPPGGTARIRFRVHNCGPATRRVFVAATGVDAPLAFGAPSGATIGALDTAEVVAEVTLPKGRDHAHLIVWVSGCHDTAVPWSVTASEQGCRTTHEISIDDGPGTWHEWSDHFQQPRFCGSARNG
jgi:hypothetical protein